MHPTSSPAGRGEPEPGGEDSPWSRAAARRPRTPFQGTETSSDRVPGCELVFLRPAEATGDLWVEEGTRPGLRALGEGGSSARIFSQRALSSLARSPSSHGHGLLSPSHGGAVSTFRVDAVLSFPRPFRAEASCPRVVPRESPTLPPVSPSPAFVRTTRLVSEGSRVWSEVSVTGWRSASPPEHPGDKNNVNLPRLYNPAGLRF